MRTLAIHTRSWGMKVERRRNLLENLTKPKRPEAFPQEVGETTEKTKKNKDETKDLMQTQGVGSTMGAHPGSAWNLWICCSVFSMVSPTSWRNSLGIFFIFFVLSSPWFRLRRTFIRQLCTCVASVYTNSHWCISGHIGSYSCI